MNRPILTHSADLEKASNAGIMATNLSSSFNPWSADGSVAGMQLGDSESGLVIARRHGLVSIKVSTTIIITAPY